MARDQQNLNTSGLNVFPIEVWELIINQIDDSKTVWNMIKAIPELQELISTEKPYWLFDQVLPLIVKYEPEEILKSSRQACKRWYNVVETFIINHPSRRCYKHNEVTRRTSPFNEFVYEDLSLDIIGSYLLMSANEIQKFTNEIECETLNPFASRIIRFFSLEGEFETVNLFLDESLKVFEKYGKKIKNASISLPFFNPEDVNQEKNLLILQKVMACFSLVHESFYIHLNVDMDLDYCSESDLSALPTLGLIEMIRFGDQVSPYIQQIVLERCRCYQKLSTPTIFQSRGEVAVTTLVELEFRGDEEDLVKCGVFAQLKKLTIRSNDEIGILNIVNVLQTLSLEELDLGETSVCRSNEPLPQISFPTIKFLRLTDYSKESLDWLRMFTSLQELEIGWFCMDSAQFGPSSSANGSLLLTEELRSYVYRDFPPRNANIWKSLPSLEALSVVKYGFICFKARFAKEYGNKPFYDFLDEWI